MGRGRGCEKEGNRRNLRRAEYRNEIEGGPRTKRERVQGYAAGLERPRKEEDETKLSWKEDRRMTRTKMMWTTRRTRRI